MKERLKLEKHELMYGPHFTEKCKNILDLLNVKQNEVINTLSPQQVVIEDSIKVS